MDAAAERAGCMRPARFLAPALLAGALLFCCGAATAHFLLNVNIRVFHAVHEPDGLRLLARVPMPYLLADKTGYAGAGGLPQPAPYTYNRMVDGEVMHYLRLRILTSAARAWTISRGRTRIAKRRALACGRGRRSARLAGGEPASVCPP